MADEQLTLDMTQGNATPLSLKSGKTYSINVKAFTVKVKVHRDPGDPTTADNSATLESTDGEYRKTVRWSDCEQIDNGVIVKFTNVKPDKKYNLLIDPGAGGTGPYYVAKNVDATKDKLEQHQSA